MSVSPNQIKSKNEKEKYILPKFTGSDAINKKKIANATLTPMNSPLLLKHINQDLIPRSSLHKESPDKLCYNEWYHLTFYVFNLMLGHLKQNMILRNARLRIINF